MNWSVLKSSGHRSYRWLWMFLLPAIWEILRLAFAVNPLLMPSVADIGRSFWQGLVTGKLASRWLLSLGIVAVGLALGACLALGLAAFARLGKGPATAVSTAAALFHPLPGLALLPLVILWFGTGPAAILAIIVHAVAWPMEIALESGMASASPAWSIFAGNLGMSKTRAFVLVALPGALPSVVGGLRIGWGRAWRGLIAAEMVFGAVAGTGGLGWHLFEGRVLMDAPALFAGLLAVMITGAVVEEGILGLWERRIHRRWGIADGQ